ncbi:uncharacterized protein SAZU_7252 [Streptomyces azureus]|uniref:Uncharacterized protein n=1 Tax=Streptomyces azureus TaxID=146537 RepID=A0A0K8PWU8_STRAJ|nr:uncharacterized protein SAZU_7252 [Streptomyces azureus]
MGCIPTAVTGGCLREPDTELLLPGCAFARRINSLLTAADRPSIWDSRPAGHAPGPCTSPDAGGVGREHPADDDPHGGPGRPRSCGGAGRAGGRALGGRVGCGF